MSWEPIANTVPQYLASGVEASGYYLKFYESGTTTPTSMATDSTGGTTLVKCQINSDGYPINGSSAVFIPHIDRTYKLALYTNSTDADANTFGNAVWVIDTMAVGEATSSRFTPTGGTETSVSEYLNTRDMATLNDAVISTSLVLGTPVRVKERTTGNGGGAMWDVVLSSTVTENTFNIVQCTGVATLSLVLRNPTKRNVQEWGAVLDGVADVSPAMQNYADFAKEKNMSLLFPNGDYFFNTTIDLTSTGGASVGHRNLEVIAGHEAKFVGSSNALDIFDISGQKRLRWLGGWFRTANHCFMGGGGVGPAYANFSHVIFDGDGTLGIKRCYKADTSLGVFWDNCNFGTDNSPDQIELAVELTGADSDQTNINKFNQCAFINCRNGVQMVDSSYARLQESFVDCWFESIGGYAISAGDNTKGMALVRCYFEACGSVSETPIILKNMTLDMEGCQMVGLQGNDDHFITANTGASINTYGTNEFQSSAGRKFVNYTALTSYQNLNGIRVIDQSTSGTLTYKDLLFDTVAQSDEKYINWSMPALSTTLTDSEPTIISRKNASALGFLSKVTNVVQLAAVSTNYDIATVNLPTSGGCRISAEAYQTIQGVGHAGAYTEILAHWNGATWIFTNITAPVVTVAGFTFTFVSVDSTHFKIQAQRTLGATTNTPFRALIKAQQASDNMFGKELIIT